MRMTAFLSGRERAGRAASTIEYGPLPRGRLWERVLAFYVPAAALLFTFQGPWLHYVHIVYVLSGLAAVGVSAVCVWRGKLYRGADILLLLFMPVCAWVSAALNFGLSSFSLVSLGYVVWAVLLSLYYALRVTSEPDRIIDLYATFSILGLLVQCLFILIHATASLFSEVPVHDIVLGCYQLGRLCGLGDANTFGFSCTALCLLSVYAFLRAVGRRRLIWVLSGLVGWFTLGLTNCRTAIIGVSFCVGLLVFSARLYGAAGKERSLSRVLTAAALGVSAGVLCTRFLYLPTILYRAGLMLIASLAHASHLSANLSDLQTRGIFGRVGTLRDRFIIWRRVLEDVRKTPLRTWLGVSIRNEDGVGGVYAGHHEIFTPHAHSTYLEMLRRYGVIGFALLIASVLRWCAAGWRCLSGTDRRVPERCLAASAAGILLMGLVEQVPFPCSPLCSLSLPFFVICGYFMNDKR